MAIVRYADPADPPTADADWTSINNQIELLFLAINLPFRVDYAANLVKKGATFYISGTKYLCDDDTAITGTASPYVKLLPSGDGASVTASYVASLTGVTWSTTYNGYYDAGTPASMYYFDEHLAMATGVITVCRTERNTNFYNHDRVSIGSGSNTSGTKSTAVGYLADATGNNSIAYGRGASAGGSSSLSVGYVANASAGNSIAIGISANATGDNSIAIRGSASNANSISVRGGASGKNAIAIGSGTVASAENSISIGYNNASNTVGEIAIGSLRYVEFASSVNEDTVFTKLYSLLGSSSTLRTVSCIGSFGIYSITSITVGSAVLITLSGSGTAKTIESGYPGGVDAIGSKLKLFFITGSSV